MHRLKRANYGDVLKSTIAVFPCTLSRFMENGSTEWLEV